MPPLISQSDVTRILKGAQAASVHLAIVVKNGEVRFVPVAEPVTTIVEEIVEENPLERWRRKRDAREAARKRRAEEASGDDEVNE